MTDVEKRIAAANFAEKWAGKGKEKQDCHPYWIELMRTVYGVEDAEQYISFEYPVKIHQTGHIGNIDGLIKLTGVLIEQKSCSIDLQKAEKQEDGFILTPFQQARRYWENLPHSLNPRWIIICNFQEFDIYDMNDREAPPQILLLKDLKEEYHRLNFLVDTHDVNVEKEVKISFEAGKIIGKLYDALKKQYDDPKLWKDLNALCVRLVFCFYADSAGIFNKEHNRFHHYLQRFSAEDARDALLRLFDVLNTHQDDRSRYLSEDLKAFPYVNGGLFEGKIEIPQLNQEIMDLILHREYSNFNWSEISPTIFGALFESTLKQEARRSSGMHYTSIENIHKVIDPLFLDDLKAEFESIRARPQSDSWRNRLLKRFQEKLSHLKFLDPACGSGNFLTETYLSLRRLENRVISELIVTSEKQERGQVMMGQEEFNTIQVSISQFYGIEINDYAVAVAKTALWIAESQMMRETESIIHRELEPFPLKTSAHIVEGNALRLDWDSVVSRQELNYIISNPPYFGARKMEQDGERKEDIKAIFGDIPNVQDLDYVTCWYKLAAKMMTGTKIETAFVSTNSVCQGAQVPILWNVLLHNYKVHINFAHQTFKWGSESMKKAAVHCVIVGFACVERAEKRLYSQNAVRQVTHINPYLMEDADYYVTARTHALCDVPKMNFGNQPRDGKNYVISADEREEILKKEPSLEKWLRPYIGSDEFIKGTKRWCLWLKDASPADIQSSKILRKKVEAVRKFRLESTAKTTNGYAKVPHLFAQITQPTGVDYILIPSVSSERREYVPIGFLDGMAISSNAAQIIPKATLYHFGVLTSNVHMAWMRTVGGRLEMRYRYSKELVYNTFPWPALTDEQKAKIEHTAQEILNARANHPDCTLAVLYNTTTMPRDLQKAHERNDRAVMEAYGFERNSQEADIVKALMRMYQNLVDTL